MRRLRALPFCFLIALVAVAGRAPAAEHDFLFALRTASDETALRTSVVEISEHVLSAHAAGRVQLSAADRAQLQIAAGRSRDAIGSIRAAMADEVASGEHDRARRWVPHLLRMQARAGDGRTSTPAYADAFRAWFDGLDDVEALKTQYWFGGDAARARADLQAFATPLAGRTRVPLDAATGLARRQAFADTLATASIAAGLVAEDESARYAVDEDVLIRTPEGATLSAVVVRSRKRHGPTPAAMQFTIYTAPVANRAVALFAAARGYAGVVVDARGKRLSGDAIRPYETEAVDAAAAVDWIAAQPWSDGRVAMYGGSYSGFAAWAATKRLPAALKTIVPYVAAIPGQGLPMENNVFLTANYAWPFHVAGNRLLEREVYADRERWQRLPEAWYASGRPYREIDRVDGAPNPLLQRWLAHPAYDAYWQAMVPYGTEFARIDIPVLTITGYYDDGQISALQYFREHLRHRPDAAHFLLIGPYDHFGAQTQVKPRAVGGYAIDAVAQFDTRDVTFDWLDHVLRDGPRPALVRDRVNLQLMGSNAWHHAPSLAAAADETVFHFSGDICGAHRCLSRTSTGTAPLVQRVDFADRTGEGHSYYPNPVVRDALEVESGFAFASAPFDAPVSVIGTFSGELRVRIDKRDFDYSISLYELKTDGSTLQLSYHVGRASHARDATHRTLLTPGEWVSLPFDRTRMVARRMDAGSRLLVVADVLKDAQHQVNMGTGKDVSDESIADAGAPLTVEWHPDSTIRIPLRTD